MYVCMYNIAARRGLVLGLLLVGVMLLCIAGQLALTQELNLLRPIGPINAQNVSACVEITT